MAKVKIKFNPVKDVMAVRWWLWTTVWCAEPPGLVQMIRGAGAREVHFRLASPPITGPCHYGIDTPTEEELIAATHSVDEIRDSSAWIPSATCPWRECSGRGHAERV